VRSDEQVYPIEKSTAVENVRNLSAFQIDLLLRTADPEALHGAARDYLSTAESLDSTADEIRRGATDLAESWRGTAASQSQDQLRRYYASARSLAIACRSSAHAMNHAATALEQAQIYAGFFQAEFHPCGFASTDPTSIESRSYQRLLIALNSAYCDAATMAPTQVAVSLPRSSRGEGGHDSDWDSIGGGSSVRDGRSSGTSGEDFRPSRLPPLIPPNKKDFDLGASRAGGRGRSQSSVVIPRTGNRSDVSNPPGDLDDGSGSPYVAGSSLAGGGGVGGLSRGAGDIDGGKSGVGALGGRTVGADGPSGRPVPRLTSAGGSQVVAPGGGILPGNGQRENDRERERRYYLKEDREIWGAQDALPAILYGDYPPPRRDFEEDDDDF
jgi:WXG100 family type VII secretion target